MAGIGGLAVAAAGPARWANPETGDSPPAIVAAGFGLLMLLICCLAIGPALGWLRRASVVVSQAPPTPTLLTLTAVPLSDDGEFFADLRTLASSRGERYTVLATGWKPTPLTDAPADVYRDPRSGRAVAVQLAGGLLWCRTRPSEAPPR